MYRPRSADRINRRRQKPRRGSSAQRGYGPEWRKIRQAYVERFPLCERCGVKPTAEVHHVLPLSRGGSHEDENLQGLCVPCHHVVHSKTEYR